MNPGSEAEKRNESVIKRLSDPIGKYPGFFQEQLPAAVALATNSKSLPAHQTFERQFLSAESMSDVSRVIFHLS